MLRIVRPFADRAVHEWTRTALTILLVAGPALLVGCSGSADSGTPAPPPAAEESGEAEDAIAVRVQEVREEPLSSIYATSATLRADKQAVVTSRTRGVIRRLAVEEGDKVSAGQALAHLEDDEQRIELDRSSAAQENTRREYERAHTLHGQGLMSDEEYEATRRAADEATQAAALAELNLSRTVIRAPFSGTVLRRHLDVGGNVSDGTPVYDLADLDPLYADVSVPERQVARLAVRQIVRLTADASGTSAEARIERIAPSVDPTTGTVKVTLTVLGKPGFRPGGFVRVAVVTDTHDNALVVPRSALVAEGRRWHLFRVGDDPEQVERIEVSRGFEEGDRVEILHPREDAPPIRSGDRVVVVGAAALNEESRIRIMDAATEPADEEDEDTATTEGDRVAT